MANLKHKGFTYEVITRPWIKGKGRHEVIRWKTGDKASWERVKYSDYLKIKPPTKL